MKCAVLVAAGGLGLRLGPGEPKGLRVLGDRPLVAHAVARMAAVAQVAEVIVAAPASHLDHANAALHDTAAAVGVPVTVIVGGVLRQDSVRLMLAQVSPDITHILVHDAARSLAPTAVGDAVVTALAAGSPAVVPVVPVVDTVARVVDGEVTGHVPRSELALVQTPQGFRRDVLSQAHAACPAGHEATDDASLVLRLGYPVTTVAGNLRSMKITTGDDVVLARAWLAHR